jgi:hypothetical protein
MVDSPPNGVPYQAYKVCNLSPIVEFSVTPYSRRDTLATSPTPFSSMAMPL